MKANHKLATLVALTALAASAQAEVLLNGNFEIYKPGTGYTVAGTLNGSLFDSYVQGVGDGRNVTGPVGTVTWDDTTTGSAADLPGWVSIHGGAPDTATNGVGGSEGLNIFAAWGDGLQRVQSSITTAVIAANTTYTITAQIDGPAGGPIEGPLAFHLMAGTVQLTADAALTSFAGGLGFQTITRTYTIAALPAGVSAGDPLTVVLGVEDTNTQPERMIWDNVALTALAAPPAAVLLNGNFEIYKPGTSYTVAGTLNGSLFQSYVQGVGDGRNVTGPVGTVTWDDTTTGSAVDLPGWVSIHGGDPDSATNGVDGSEGLNIFAAWGVGLQRVQSSVTTALIAANTTYTITAQIDGPAGGPIEGPLAFYLMAGTVQLTADAALPSFTGGLGFQTITRTYTIGALPDGVSAGDPLTVVLGVEDTNTQPERMIWDNVALIVGGAPSYSTWASANGIPGQPASDDFDKDGLTNLVEYALDLSPTVSSVPPGTFNGSLLSFNKGAEAMANGDVTYEIEQSTTLGGWTVVVPNAPASATISYTLPSGQPKEFARLKITQIP